MARFLFFCFRLGFVLGDDRLRQMRGHLGIAVELHLVDAAPLGQAAQIAGFLGFLSGLAGGPILLVRVDFVG